MQVRTRTWFGFVVLVSLLFLAASRIAVFQPLEDGALAVASPIESALRDVTRPVADFINNLTDINRLTDENRALREENERLVAENSRLSESEQELQQLQSLLNIREPAEGETLVSADVFAVEPSNSQQLIAIDKGSTHGLEEDMLVLSQQGSVIGTVSRVLDRAAWVTLVSDQTSAVSAFIQESRAQGVVVGSPDGSLKMEFVEETADVTEGDLVLTSGVSGRHPANEVIGQVVDVQRSPQELFQEVSVQPLADLTNLEAVLVLTSFVPIDLESP